MNKKMTSLCGALLVAGGLGLGSAFGAPPADGPKGHGMDRQQRGEKMFAELGLSEDQQKQLKAHRESHRTETKEIFEKMKAKREALRTELEKPNFSESAVKGLNDELKTLHNRMADQRLAGILAVRKILTPEQYAKFVQLREERMKEMKANRGKDGKGKGPKGPHHGGEGGMGGPEDGPEGLE